LQLDLGLLAFVCQHRSLQELGHLYGIEADVYAIGLETVSKKYFSGANIEIVLMDDDLKMDKMMGMGWHGGLNVQATRSGITGCV
jgi:hypothetical protein